MTTNLHPSPPRSAEDRRFRMVLTATLAVLLVPGLAATALKATGLYDLPWEKVWWVAMYGLMFSAIPLVIVGGFPRIVRKLGLPAMHDGDERERKIIAESREMSWAFTSIVLIVTMVASGHFSPTYSWFVTLVGLHNFGHIASWLYLGRKR